MNRFVGIFVLAMMGLMLLGIRLPDLWPANLAAIRQSHKILQIDLPGNRLINGSFEHTMQINSEENERFPPWSATNFWNNFQAEGWRKIVAGNRSANALELNLSDALGPPYHIGVQQRCGNFSAGDQVELQVDLFIPDDLQSAYANVQAKLYQSNQPHNHAGISLQERTATQKWVRLSAKGQAPTIKARYECMLVIHLVAETPLQGVLNVARFDNVVLRKVGDKQ